MANAITVTPATTNTVLTAMIVIVEDDTGGVGEQVR